MAATHTFPLIYAPDGTLLTTSNCAYCCSFIGSDANAGTKELPYGTLTKSVASGKQYIYPVGTFIENVTTFNNSVFSTYLGSCYFSGSVTISGNTASRRIDNIIFNSCSNTVGSSMYNCQFTFLSGLYQDASSISGSSNLHAKTYNAIGMGNDIRVFSNLTAGVFKNYLSSSSYNTLYNGLIYEVMDLYNYTALTVSVYPIFTNSLLRKSLVWKWNGVIVPITYTAATGNLATDSAQWKTDIFNSLTTYYNTLSTSTSKTYLASILSNWSAIFPSTTMVVDDINCCPIFNLYSSGAPVDYSLKISTTNPALTMSSVNSYVGAYKASITPTYDLTTLKELDSNGNETSNTPDILVLGTNGSLYPSPSATQFRNRVKTNLVVYPRGYSFDGVQSLLTSGLAARYGYGKYQSYTTSYTPQESVEIEPKNADGSDSTFPKFSAKLNGVTQMWYHQYGTGTVAITTGGVITGTGTAFLTQFVVGQPFYVGNEGHVVTSITSNTVMNVASWSVAVAAGAKYASVPTSKINTPVLFSDLASYYAISSDLNMTEYGTWAVTNADYDSYYLNQKTGVQLTSIVLFVFKFIININYYA